MSSPSVTKDDFSETSPMTFSRTSWFSESLIIFLVTSFGLISRSYFNWPLRLILNCTVYCFLKFKGEFVISNFKSMELLLNVETSILKLSYFFGEFDPDFWTNGCRFRLEVYFFSYFAMLAKSLLESFCEAPALLSLMVPDRTNPGEGVSGLLTEFFLLIYNY